MITHKTHNNTEELVKINGEWRKKEGEGTGTTYRVKQTTLENRQSIKSYHSMSHSNTNPKVNGFRPLNDATTHSVERGRPFGNGKCTCRRHPIWWQSASEDSLAFPRIRLGPNSDGQIGAGKSHSAHKNSIYRYWNVEGEALALHCMRIDEIYHAMPRHAQWWWWTEEGNAASSVL